MDLEEVLTDISGLMVIVIGLVSLTESLLQVKLVGHRLPLTQGAFISMFAIGFGAVLMTENATKALKAFKNTCNKAVR